MSNLTLWHLPGSPPSWTVRMMAEILGLKLELKTVDFKNKEHKSAEYRKMNPMGTIPVLKDGDFIISESHAIIKYLLDKYGKGKYIELYPSDLEQRALVDQAMFFDTGVAFIRVKDIALPSVFDDLDGVTSKLAAETEDAYDIVEHYLQGGNYVAIADVFTIADLSLGSSIFALNGLHPLDVDRFPRTAAWLDRLRGKQFFQNIAIPGSDGLSTFVKSCWGKNKIKALRNNFENNV